MRLVGLSSPYMAFAQETEGYAKPPRPVNEREDRDPLERAVLSGNVRQIQGKVSPGPLHRKEIRHVIITTT